jgi:hypothetical protein
LQVEDNHISKKSEVEKPNSSAQKANVEKTKKSNFCIIT